MIQNSHSVHKICHEAALAEYDMFSWFPGMNKQHVKQAAQNLPLAELSWGS